MLNYKLLGKRTTAMNTNSPFPINLYVSRDECDHHEIAKSCSSPNNDVKLFRCFTRDKNSLVPLDMGVHVDWLDFWTSFTSLLEELHLLVMSWWLHLYRLFLPHINMHLHILHGTKTVWGLTDMGFGTIVKLLSVEEHLTLVHQFKF